ncbi:MAG: PTS IIA-like nitrogen regulatory protein PtsN [Candidatus Competibacteraceae bacterium]
MNITDLITAKRIACDEVVTSKKRVLELLGELIVAEQNDLTAREVFDTLVGRERLGSTGLGHGVALPHGRLSQIQHAIGAFIKLKEGIDFDAIDRQPVDLIFALLVPEHFTDEHLKILAYLAEMFSDSAFCHQLRSAESNDTLFAHLSHWQTS